MLIQYILVVWLSQIKISIVRIFLAFEEKRREYDSEVSTTRILERESSSLRALRYLAALREPELSEF
jgi:hypothetical protein